MNNNNNHLFEKINKFTIHLETGVLVTLLLAMILIAVTQIFLRNVMDTGIIWAEPLVRVLVLWTALLGAMMATRSKQHIKIDVFTHLIPEKYQHIAELVTQIFAAIICAIVAYYSVLFVITEYQDGGMAFAQVPNWVCESIIPIAFIVIAWRYLLSSYSHIISLKSSSS